MQTLNSKSITKINKQSTERNNHPTKHNNKSLKSTKLTITTIQANNKPYPKQHTSKQINLNQQNNNQISKIITNQSNLLESDHPPFKNNFIYINNSIKTINIK